MACILNSRVMGKFRFQVRLDAGCSYGCDDLTDVIDDECLSSDSLKNKSDIKLL